MTFLTEFKKQTSRHLSNIPGWRTNRKIIVIESDDWGSIRMSSGEAFNSLRIKGVKASGPDEERYLRNDSLASENDLSSLFEILASVKDKHYKSAVFTAVSVVANPDFNKIKENKFQEYFYEPFNETLNRFPKHRGSFKLWQEGLEKRLFVPQFHGREHLNVANWLKALRAGEQDTMVAFDHGVYGITPRKLLNHISYQAAFDLEEISEVNDQKSVIRDGLRLFEKLHHYEAEYFIPPNGPFNNSLEEVAADEGIKYMGTAKIQSEPIGNGRFRKHYHYLGQKNKYNQLYLTRNCIFEPSSNLKTDWVDACMNDISIAFRWYKPAVISSHRVNYIGWINPSNRDKGLMQLKALLNIVISKWPDVEFMTSDQLGWLIKHDKSSSNG